MESSVFFLLPDGRLRAGWRLLLFVFFFAAATILLQGAASSISRFSTHTILLTASSYAFLAAAALATWLMTSLIEHLPFSSVGMEVQGSWRGQMVIGIACGSGLVGAVTAAEWAAGVIRFQSTGGGDNSALAAIGGGIAIFSVAAVAEELLFRGYGFQRLIEGVNAPVAVVLSSLLFGAVHQWNPHATTLALANTVLAGVLLAVAYVRTRALWLSIGFHFSWNWTLSLIGMPVSGVGLGRMPWEAVPSSNYIWLHGGDYGPEGGLIATAALTIVIVLLLRSRHEIFSSASNAG